MTVSVCRPLIKSLGSRIYRGMLHVAMQTWSMTCCVRYADYGRFSSESFTQTHNQCAKHVQIFFNLFFIPVPSPKKLFLVPTLFVLNSCFSVPLRRHPHSCNYVRRARRAQISAQINQFYPRTGYGLQEGVHAISCPPPHSCCPLSVVCVCVSVWVYQCYVAGAFLLNTDTLSHRVRG